MKKIPLTQGEYALVDDEDFEWLSQWEWHVRRGAKTKYAIRNGPRDASGNQKKIPMHRVIMETPVCMVVDHIDHNGLNNQKKNMRNCTPSENGGNRVVSKNNRIGIKGVAFRRGRKGNSRTKPYAASIKHNGINHFLGYYRTAEEAALAYGQKAKELFGEFARPNLLQKIHG